MQYVAILSSDNAGGVRAFAPLIRQLGYCPLLISDQDDDLNSSLCDRHLVVNWNTPNPVLTKEIKEALPFEAGSIYGVVNLLEPLAEKVVAIPTAHQSSATCENLNFLTRKDLFRSKMRELGVSNLSSHSGTEEEILTREINYPVVAKPAAQSGGSFYVRKVENDEELSEFLSLLTGRLGANTLILVEEYFRGHEFSIDGYLQNGFFHTILAAEKPDHDDSLLHDSGLIVMPPQNPLVKEAVSAASFILRDVGNALGINNMWFHAEFRVNSAGKIEIIEINPRPGGRLFAKAAEVVSGLDPLKIVLSMAVNQKVDIPSQSNSSNAFLMGHVSIERFEEGVFEVDEDAIEEINKHPHVLFSSILSPYRVSNLERENFFCDILIEGEDMASLKESYLKITNIINKGSRKVGS
ncbi:hypothetical protein GCM10009621_10150 [Corynebacterium felinum]|nr:ATP-grasp domain-containing protein [Corynebacterium felinum]